MEPVRKNKKFLRRFEAQIEKILRSLSLIQNLDFLLRILSVAKASSQLPVKSAFHFNVYEDGKYY